MNCPYCDNEIVSEDATFCPKCEKSLAPEEEMQQESIEVQQKQPELVLVAAMLTIIAAAFTASMGYLGVDQYITVVSNLSMYPGSTASELLGFLIFGILRLITSALALTGSIFMLQRKQFKISMIGAILPLVSVFGTYIIIQQYNYGYISILQITEPPVLIMTIMSIMMLFKSKAEFI